MGEGLVEVWGKGMLGGQPKQAVNELDLIRAGLHRLLQPYHGKAIQMDLPRKGAGRMNCRVIYAKLY